MTHLTGKKAFLFLTFILIQLTSLAQVAQRNYYTNYTIAGQTAESTDEDYILLHKAYDGAAMLSEHFVQGKITAIRGAVTSWNPRLLPGPISYLKMATNCRHWQMWKNS